VSWVNAVVQGVMLGGFYALLACGLSIMFGVMRIINLAHGDLAVLGAYLVWLLLGHFQVPAPVALALVLPGMLLIGYLLQIGILNRSLRSGILTPLLATFGLSVVLQNLLLIAFSPDVRSLGGSGGAITTASWKVSHDLSIPALGVLILAVAVLIVTGLQLFLTRTRAGSTWRAASQDPDVAGLVGINSRAVYGTATAVAVAIAAVAGFFLAIRSVFDPVSGPTQLIFAFEAVVIGGMGSLWGTLLGGIVLGVAQTIGAQINPQYAVLAGHVVFLAVLVTRRGGGLFASPAAA
jgi:branched-chain amino acid transport system permease protein